MTFCFSVAAAAIGLLSAVAWFASAQIGNVQPGFGGYSQQNLRRVAWGQRLNALAAGLTAASMVCQSLSLWPWPWPWLPH